MLQAFLPKHEKAFLLLLSPLSFAPPKFREFRPGKRRTKKVCEPPSPSLLQQPTLLGGYETRLQQTNSRISLQHARPRPKPCVWRRQKGKRKFFCPPSLLAISPSVDQTIVPPCFTYVGAYATCAGKLNDGTWEMGEKALGCSLADIESRKPFPLRENSMCKKRSFSFEKNARKTHSFSWDAILLQYTRLL